MRILEGAYSFVIISILDPEAMYIVKNSGTMVIGFPDCLAKGKDDQEQTSLDSISNVDSDEDEERKEGEAKSKKHKFQVVTSDTTVFQDMTKNYYNIEDKEILRLSLKDKVE